MLDVDQMMKQALAAQRDGDLLKAEQLFRQILEQQPNNSEASHCLGVISVAAHKPKSALGFFKMALEADPSTEKYWISYIDTLQNEGHINTAKAVLNEARKRKLTGSLFDLKEAEFNKADSQSPSVQQLNDLIASFKNGQFEQAEKLARSIIDKFPEHQLGWKVLGVLLGQTDRNTEAVAANQRAIRLSPQDDEARSNLGNVLRKLGRLNEAEASCQKAIQLNPKLAENHNNLGTVLQDMNRLEDAEACYRQAISLKADFVEPHHNLAGILRQLGRLVDAEASIITVIGLEPGFALAHFDLGTLLREQGRIEAAEVSFRRAIELRSNFADAYNGLGGALKELGRLTEAEESYRQAITIHSDFALAHCNLAVVLKDLGKLEESESSCRRALELDPDLKEAHYNLGTLLFEKKLYREASAEFTSLDMFQSNLFAMKCAYHIDEQSRFTKKLNSFISTGGVNAVVGSLSCCASAKYGIPRTNPFCNDPLKLVTHTDLKTSCDFERIFVKTALDTLSDPTVARKDQVHLSNGIQTAGNFFSLNRVLNSEIEDIIHREIEKYRDGFSGSAEGLITHWPEEYEISGWLVSYQSGGSITAHMHDTGWITGSLYINVPPKSEVDSGNLVLRMHDREIDEKEKTSQEMSIDVKSGSLCFFPSSLLHHTIPFEEKEDRIVLAFDVIPKAFV